MPARKWYTTAPILGGGKRIRSLEERRLRGEIPGPGPDVIERPEGMTAYQGYEFPPEPPVRREAPRGLAPGETVEFGKNVLEYGREFLGSLARPAVTVARNVPRAVRGEPMEYPEGMTPEEAQNPFLAPMFPWIGVPARALTAAVKPFLAYGKTATRAYAAPTLGEFARGQVGGVGRRAAKSEEDILKAAMNRMGPRRPKPSPKVEAPAAKQPWEMSRGEYKQSRYEEALDYLKRHPKEAGKFPESKAKMMADEDVGAHSNFVRNALSEGKPVPPEVLADYPELAAQAKPVVAPQKILTGKALDEALAGMEEDVLKRQQAKDIKEMEGFLGGRTKGEARKPVVAPEAAPVPRPAAPPAGKDVSTQAKEMGILSQYGLAEKLTTEELQRHLGKYKGWLQTAEPDFKYFHQREIDIIEAELKRRGIGAVSSAEVVAPGAAEVAPPQVAPQPGYLREEPTGPFARFMRELSEIEKDWEMADKARLESLGEQVPKDYLYRGPFPFKLRNKIMEGLNQGVISENEARNLIDDLAPPTSGTAEELIARFRGRPLRPGGIPERPMTEAEQAAELEALGKTPPPPAAKAGAGGLPPVKKGFTRLYRGEEGIQQRPVSSGKEILEGRGRWFSTDSSIATGYGRELYYVDVPNSVADDAVRANEEMLKKANIQYPLAGDHLLSSDWAARAKPAAQAGAEVPPVEPPPGAGIPPGAEGVSPPRGPVVAKVMKMWEAEPQKPTVRQRIGEAYRGFQAEVTDELARLNEVAGRARQAWKAEHGTPMPPELDFEFRAQVMRGSPGAARELLDEALSGMRKALGRDINQDYVNTYLHLKRAIEIEQVKGPQRLIAGGIKGAAEAEAGLREIASTLGPEKFARLEKASQSIKTMMDNQLDRQIQAGLIDPKLGTWLHENYPWYNPIRYLEDELIPHAVGRGGRNLSVTSAHLRRLSELGRESLREPPLESISRYMAQSEALIKRQEAVTALIDNLKLDPQMAGQVTRAKIIRPVAQVEGETIFRPARGETRGTISRMEGGKRVAYDVPAWVEQVAKGLDSTPGNDVASRVGRMANAVPRMMLTEYNPAFIGANVAFDTVTVAQTRGILPQTVAGALYRNLKGLFTDDPFMRELMKAGADVGGFHGAPMEAVQRSLLKGDLMRRKDIPALIGEVLSAPLRGLRTVGHAAEYAPRRAAAEKVFRETGSMVGSAQAFRAATGDWGRAGKTARFLNSFFIYLNPAIQGTLIPLRALRDIPAAKWGLAGLGTLTVSTYLWNRQFAEWEDLPAWRKYTGLGVMIPSNTFNRFGQPEGRYVSFIPMTREYAALTGTISYILARLEDKAPEDFGEFAAAVFPQVNPISSIVGGGIPVPTFVGETITEIALNKDTFRDREIVPGEYQGLPLAEQFDQNTSEVARRVGPRLGLSPFQVDHLMRVGSMWEVFNAADAVLRAQEGQDPRIQGLAAQLEAIQENMPPETIARERRAFLSALSPEDRKAVELEERRREPGIPIADAVSRRFYRRASGQLYRSGMKQTAQAMGLSEQQTREASWRLGKLSGDLYNTEQANEAKLERGEINRIQWRESHKTLGTLYRGGLLAIGLNLPGAAQMLEPEKQAEFRQSVYTLAGKMADTRSRGQLLVAAYRALAVEEIVPGVLEEDAFKARDAFVDGLAKGDKALFKAELEASMTRTEKEYAQAQETLRPYWRIGDNMVKTLKKAGDGDVQPLLDEWRMRQGMPKEGHNLSRIREIENNKLYKLWQRQVDSWKLKARFAEEAIDDALVEWYGLVAVRERKKR